MIKLIQYQNSNILSGEYGQQSFHMQQMVVQSSAVITQSNIVRYYIMITGTEAEYRSDTGSTKKHPIPRPNG